MCGIVGIVDDFRHSVAEVRESAERMSAVVAHRGPDDWGFVILHAGQVEHRSKSCPEGEIISRPEAADAGRTVILVHRRLSIIDLSSGGHQPMRTKDGRFWITYNGEIYNYKELRRELEAEGVSFRSNSDTEVLVSLYAREGVEGLRKLRGMFAFAVWDEDRRELFLARDRFGIKPLYYAQTSQGLFLFSSELKAFLSSGLVSPDIDREAEFAFLQRGSIRAPKTFYRDIKALPPAHWARWDGKQLLVESYWSLSKTLARDHHASTSIAEVADSARHALIESVKAHMISDVPVGIFLSGGLDSTALVAAVRQFYSGPLRTFTVVFPGTQWDESHLARQAAAYYGTDHVELEVTKDEFYGGLDKLFSAMDQPTVDGVNTYFVAKSARDAGVKVALSGLGGDEILGGYKSFVDVPRLQRYLRAARCVPWVSGAAASLTKRLPIRWAPKLAQLLRCAPDNLEALWRDYRALFTDEQIHDDFGLEATDRENSQAPGFQPSSETSDPFWSIARLEMERFMIPQLLRDSDVFTMCHGIELRTPFVDHLFLSAAVGAGTWPRNGAPSHKIALFRQMGGFLPANHLAQPKMGFTLPFEIWLREALLNDVSSGISRDMRSLLNRSYHRRFLDGFIRGHVHWSRIWSLYVLERFKARGAEAC
jgi:asparagine synthase (glutamine-hydrolysing)